MELQRVSLWHGQWSHTNIYMKICVILGKFMLTGREKKIFEIILILMLYLHILLLLILNAKTPIKKANKQISLRNHSAIFKASSFLYLLATK